MVYMSPTKVARVVDFRKLNMSDREIAQTIGIHRTTVARIVKRFDKSQDPYYVNPKTGCPCKLDVRDVHVAARMLAKTEAANATEVVKKAFPEVSRHTLARRLKEFGLVCRVRRSRPYISPANKEKHRLWAMEHVGWTVEDWKRVGFSDESKFLLFKSDSRQYAWFHPGQALDE
ncbi:Transposable element Tc1 transposase [Hypsizygus marmoreus]|uniref:Transposable element Tc1 transposase n=1 Tax=Hypsizygus marmoreus TaxID=39966 RepID=A0A369JJX9_HYPMA|nr:Transposable element Tc1 transposase [Hypsizygus marmoreus]